MLIPTAHQPHSGLRFCFVSDPQKGAIMSINPTQTSFFDCLYMSPPSATNARTAICDPYMYLTVHFHLQR